MKTSKTFNRIGRHGLAVAMLLAAPWLASGEEKPVAAEQGSAQAAAPAAPAAPAATPISSKPGISLEGTDLHLGKLPPITFHGFLSQGFLLSSKYNYLDPNSRDGSFKFFEAGLNASMNPFPRTRLAIQGFSYDVGDAGQYDLALDYGLAEYTFNDNIGIRGGRIRRAEGLYNDIQDLDMARTWVLLPQGMYSARWRDMYTTIDGGEVFGSLSLRKAGSLSYNLHAGFQQPTLNGGLALQKSAVPPNSPLKEINSLFCYGGQIWWRTPVDGLRVGGALNYVQDVRYTDMRPVTAEGSPFVTHYSIEYLIKNWTFQAEYFTYHVDYHSSNGKIVHLEPDSWYVSAAYRFNKYFEAGTYYTEYYQNTQNRSGTGTTPTSDSKQRDVAIALRFDPKPWWIVKAELHHINGTGHLYDNVSNPNRDGKGWWMMALKTTFTF